MVQRAVARGVVSEKELRLAHWVGQRIGVTLVSGPGLVLGRGRAWEQVVTHLALFGEARRVRSAAEALRRAGASVQVVDG